MVFGFDETKQPITAHSTPNYDEFGPDSSWNCDDWIAWHQAMSALFGQQVADDKWAKAWLAGVSTAGGGTGTAPGSGKVFDSVPIDCRTINTRFQEYVMARPVLKAAVWTGLGGTVMLPLAGATQAVRDLGWNMKPILIAAAVGLVALHLAKNK